MKYELSRETRKDPSHTGKLRKEFADSLIRVFNAGELEERLYRVVDKYLRQGYLAGQIYAAVVLKQYKPPFKPTIDEDSLLNITADAHITLEELLDGSYQPDKSIITVLSTRLMGAFNRGIVDFSRRYGITNFQFLVVCPIN